MRKTLLVAGLAGLLLTTTTPAMAGYDDGPSGPVPQMDAKGYVVPKTTFAEWARFQANQVCATPACHQAHQRLVANVPLNGHALADHKAAEAELEKLRQQYTLAAKQ